MKIILSYISTSPVIPSMPDLYTPSYCYYLWYFDVACQFELLYVCCRLGSEHDWLSKFFFSTTTKWFYSSWVICKTIRSDIKCSSHRINNLNSLISLPACMFHSGYLMSIYIHAVYTLRSSLHTILRRIVDLRNVTK